MARLTHLFKRYRFKRALKSLGSRIGSGPDSFTRTATASVEPAVKVGHVKITAAHVSIGAHTYIRSGANLGFVSHIGRFCSIGPNCIIGQEKYNHPTDWVSSHPFQYEDGGTLDYTPSEQLAWIGHDVWMGEGAMVLAGVSVGTGAIIATRALVTRDVPPYAIVGGNPAKVLKYRHTEQTIARLLASEWWALDVDVLRGLPLDDPETCLRALEDGAALQRAHYTCLTVSRNGVGPSGATPG